MSSQSMTNLTDDSNLKTVRQKFNSFNHIVGESLQTQINRFSHLMTEMKNVGFKLSFGEVNKKLLDSLPCDWDTICTIIKRKHDMYKTSLSE